MTNELLNKFLFIFLSVLLLIIGMLGILRTRERPGLLFEWKNNHGTVIVTNSSSKDDAYQGKLKNGDLIKKLSDYYVLNGEEIEFIIDKHRPGETINILIQRGHREVALVETLIPKYNRRFIIFNLLLGLFFWLIGNFVFIKKNAERTARLFAYACITIAFSILMVWPGHPPHFSIAGYTFPFLYFLVYPLTPALMLYFFISYPVEKKLLRKYKNITTLIFSPGVCFVILLEISYLLALYYSSIEYFRSFFHLYNAFRVYFMIYLLISMGSLIQSFKLADTRENRRKILWILVGICTGAAPFLLLWTFPHILGITPLVHEDLTYLFLMLIPLSIAFSIVKYQALNIDVIVNRGIVYALITSLIILFYLILVGFAGHFLQIITPGSNQIFIILFTIIAAMLFAPLKQRVQAIVDKTFYRVRYNYRLALRDFSETLVSANTRKELVTLICEKIERAIPVERMIIILKSSNKQMFEIKRCKGLSRSEMNGCLTIFQKDLVNMIGARKIPFVKKGRSELTDMPEFPPHEVLDKLNIEVLIPIIIDDQLKGALLLGKKLFGTRYTEQDLELLMQMIQDGYMAIERLRLQESMILQRAEKDKLEELNRLKSEFISHVSHELRSPLTSIQWSLENLLDGIPEQPTPKIREYLVGLHKSSCHLSRMIENLLDITRIEAGRIDIYMERLNLVEEINNCLESIKPLAVQKAIHIEVSIKDDLWIKGDRDHFQAIITNLLDNAIKYSHEKSTITVEARQGINENYPKTTINSTGKIIISVTDFGVGIPDEKLDTIFERFERIKVEKAVREKGLGLGLHIVKKLVELMGGEIWVDSKVNEGSTFSFTLNKA